MHDSIAIIGMACRFPGARSVAEFWRNLVDGVESVRFFSDHELLRAGVDPDLLAQPNYVKASPVLDDVHGFDAEFFHYAPREAETMDPQQRLMLQTSWEALEDAGYAPGAIRAAVGVFAGAGGVVSSYLAANLEHYPEFIGATGGLAHLGNDKDFVSTRVSFKLNLTGPSVNVQTACSTSLVAVHLACRSLQARECDMALAGVAAVRFPHIRGYLAQKSDILSPDGHVRAFDAAAEGTIFGSGVGTVVLKRLADAIADGDRIDAVIHATAINNDGSEKVSYTASSVGSQAAAMVEAMVAAEVSPDDIGYVECHGTGTAVGDPLEIMALTHAFRAMGATRTQSCRIGSVKTNIGHLEQAAGMASLIKTALVLKHGLIPPLLNFRTPNPAIPFEKSPFAVADRLTEWTQAPRLALVNGLGLGGTNACCIVGQAPEPAARAEDSVPSHAVLCVSARSAAAVREQALRMAAAIDGQALVDVCATTNRGRARFPYRLAATGSSPEELRDALRAAAGDVPERSQPQKAPVFLFPGQGSHYPAAAKELYDTYEPFRRRLDETLARVQTHLAEPLLDVLYGDRGELLYDTRYAQPLLFAIEYAMAKTWESWGIVPSAVLGHSVGEIAAACFAGAMPLDDAAALICRRAQLMGAIERRGTMAAVFASPEQVEPYVAPLAASVAIAAINAPDNTVISGDADAVRGLLAQLAAAGISTRELRVSQAFHSPLLDPILDELEAFASGLAFRPSDVPLIGNVTGRPVEELTGAYWREHARRPVRFMDGVRTALAAGTTAFIEVGPGSTLLTLARLCARGETPAWIPTVERDRPDWLTISAAAGELFVRGHSIDFDAFYHPFAPRRVALPTYPFETKEYALAPRKSAPAPSGPRRAIDPNARPLTGQRLRARVEGAIYEAGYSIARIPFFDDHRIYGLPVLPTTAALDAALSCGHDLAGQASEVVLGDVTYWEPLIVPDSEDLVVQTVVTPEDGGRFSFDLCSDDGSVQPEWRRHVGGHIEVRERSPQRLADLAGIRRRCAIDIDPGEYYATIREKGFHYGPLFRAVKSIALGTREVLTRVELDDSLTAEQHLLHPALVDAALHVYSAVADDYTAPREQRRNVHPFLPTGVGTFRVLQPRARAAWVHVTRDTGGEIASETMVVDVHLYDDAGAPIGELRRLSLRRMSREMLHPSATDPTTDWVYELAWRESDEGEPSSVRDAKFLILGDRAGAGTSLRTLLEREGALCAAADREAAGDEASLRAVLTAHGPGPWRIVCLWPLDHEAPDDPEQTLCADTLALMRAVGRLRASGVSARVCFVTRLAQAVPGEPRDVHVAQGAVWGMARTFAWEVPQCWEGLIDLDGPQSAEASAESLLRELCTATRSDQRAIRGGRRFVARLIRVAKEGSRRDGPLFDRNAAYLLTGGLGSLGLRVAKWMTLQGAGRIVITSRRGREGNERAIADLEKSGVNVTVLSADAADAAAMQEVFAAIDSLGVPLKGIFHCAGILDDGVIDQMDWQKFRRVTDPKILGGWNIHSLSLGYELDHFVLFSSILSLMGSAGQVNYTAGNAFLDALAAFRQSRGLPCQVMNWGPWDEGGLATSAGEVGRSIWKARGIGYIPPAGGMEVLDDLMRRDRPAAAIMIADWSRFVRQFSAVPDFYAELAQEAGAAAARTDSVADVRRRLAEAPVHERRARLIAAVAAEVTNVLGLDRPIDPATQTGDLGLDSLMSVNLLNRLEQFLDRPVAVSKLIQGPSVIELVDHLYPELKEVAPGEPAPAPAIAPAARGGRWLVPLQPNPDAVVRLICFPFAGGGSAAFRRWGGLVHPAVEVLAVEPPGRLRRIEEQPIRSIHVFVEDLARVIHETCSDKPFAFFGHCLGGLTLFETASRLRARGASPVHVFVSGARPPHLLTAIGPFERRLARELVDHPRYDPLEPLHRQDGEVFASALRHFDIPETAQLLADPDLRDAMLPAIRAEFEMSFNYHAPVVPQAWDVPFTCMTGEHDQYVTRAQMLEWSRYTESDFQLLVRPGSHFLMAEDPQFVVGTINRALQDLQQRSAAFVA